VNLAGLAWSLAQTSVACKRELFTHALHSDRVFIFPRKKTQLTWCWSLMTKTMA